MKKYYTYLLINSLNNQPFYVGKGTSSRMYHHKHDALNPSYSYRSVRRKIQKILKTGGDIMYQQDYHITEEVAFDVEIELIKQHGRKDLGTGILCNLTDGGEGSGGNQSPASVAKRAKTNTGKKRSEKSKQYMSKIQKEMADARREKYGYARSPESRQKQSDATKGKSWSENARNVIRNKPTAKVVLVYEKITGNFVGEWESISLCGKELSCDITAVWKICEGKLSTPAPNGKVYPMKSHKGYTFKYKN